MHKTPCYVLLSWNNHCEVATSWLMLYVMLKRRQLCVQGCKGNEWRNKGDNGPQNNNCPGETGPPHSLSLYPFVPGMLVVCSTFGTFLRTDIKFCFLCNVHLLIFLVLSKYTLLELLVRDW